MRVKYLGYWHRVTAIQITSVGEADDTFHVFFLTEDAEGTKATRCVTMTEKEFSEQVVLIGNSLN